MCHIVNKLVKNIFGLIIHVYNAKLIVQSQFCLIFDREYHVFGQHVIKRKKYVFSDC